MYDGHSELWDLINVITQHGEAGGESQIHHISGIAKAYLAKAQRLETASPFAFLGTPLSKKEDRMAECAKIYLKLGDFKGYCEKMVLLSTCIC